MTTPEQTLPQVTTTPNNDDGISPADRLRIANHMRLRLDVFEAEEERHLTHAREARIKRAKLVAQMKEAFPHIPAVASGNDGGFCPEKMAALGYPPGDPLQRCGRGPCEPKRSEIGDAIRGVIVDDTEHGIEESPGVDAVESAAADE